MPEMIHFPTDPADPVELLELDGPEDLSAFFCDQFDAVHGQGWTVYLWTAPQPRAYTPEDRNHQAAAFLNAHAANGRTDWDTFLRGPVVLVCRNGMASADAAKKLKKAGFEQVHWLDGGIAAWDAAGLPLVKGRA